jgi:hypothetical protein
MGGKDGRGERDSREERKKRKAERGFGFVRETGERGRVGIRKRKMGSQSGSRDGHYEQLVGSDFL